MYPQNLSRLHYHYTTMKINSIYQHYPKPIPMIWPSTSSYSTDLTIPSLRPASSSSWLLLSVWCHGGQAGTCCTFLLTGLSDSETLFFTRLPLLLLFFLHFHGQIRHSECILNYFFVYLFVFTVFLHIYVSECASVQTGYLQCARGWLPSPVSI